MKVYIASAYQSRDDMRTYADELKSIGMTCTSTWLTETVEITPGTSGAANDVSDAQVAAHVANDLRDVQKADALVLFTESATGHRGGGGRHVEMGYATALRKAVIVVGDAENVFQRSPSVTRVPNWHAAVLSLVAMRERQPQAVEIRA